MLLSLGLGIFVLVMLHLSRLAHYRESFPYWSGGLAIQFLVAWQRPQWVSFYMDLWILFTETLRRTVDFLLLAIFYVLVVLLAGLIFRFVWNQRWKPEWKTVSAEKNWRDQY